jgi:hypothetical protein
MMQKGRLDREEEEVRHKPLQEDSVQVFHLNGNFLLTHSWVLFETEHIGTVQFAQLTIFLCTFTLSCLDKEIVVHTLQLV